jgi:hypothetical protein
MLGQHGEILRREEGRRAAAGHHRHGNAGLLEQRQRRLEEVARVRLAVGKRHEPVETHPG